MARQKENKAQKKGFANVLIKIILPVAAVLLISAVSAAVYFHLSPSHNPKMLVKSYIAAAEKKDWAEVYNKMPLSGSFVSESDFINYCGSNPEEMMLSHSPISDFVIEKDAENDNFIYYSVNYAAQDDSNGTFYITVQKSKSINEYKIIPTSKSFCSFNVYAPDKSTVSLGGKVLSDFNTIKAGSETDGSSYSINEYTVNYILAGTYDLKIENEFAQPVETAVEIAPGAENQYYYESSINENTYNALCTLTGDYISKIYSGIISGSVDYSSIYVSDYYSGSGIESAVAALAQDVNYTDNIEVTGFELISASPSKEFNDFSTDFNCREKNEIELRINFDYNYTYKAKNYAEADFTETKTDSGYFNADYVYENGIWKLNRIYGKAWF